MLHSAEDAFLVNALGEWSFIGRFQDAFGALAGEAGGPFRTRPRHKTREREHTGDIARPFGARDYLCCWLPSGFHTGRSGMEVRTKVVSLMPSILVISGDKGDGGLICQHNQHSQTNAGFGQLSTNASASWSRGRCSRLTTPNLRTNFFGRAASIHTLPALVRTPRVRPFLALRALHPRARHTLKCKYLLYLCT